MMLCQVFSPHLFLAMLAILNNELTPLQVFPHHPPPAPPLALSVSLAHHDLLLALPLMPLKLSQPYQLPAPLCGVRACELYLAH